MNENYFEEYIEKEKKKINHKKEEQKKEIIEEFGEEYYKNLIEISEKMAKINLKWKIVISSHNTFSKYIYNNIKYISKYI